MRTQTKNRLIAVFGLSSVLMLAQMSPAWAVGYGDTAPAWSGTDMLNDSQIDFPAQLDEKPAVLIFWATWCSYCKAFMPYAKQIQADYQDQGIQVITFNAKERGRGDPKAYAQSLDFPMIAITAADDIAEQYNIQFIPGLMVVAGNGIIAYRRRSTDLPAGTTVSQQWDKEVRQVLDNLLAAAESSDQNAALAR